MDTSKVIRVQDFNRLYKELDDLYHDIALKIGIPDSVLTVLYAVCRMGGGCMQRDICEQAFVNKQTVNFAIRKLEAMGYLYLEAGRGRDKHIYLTEEGRKFSAEKVCPLIQAEDHAFSVLTCEEQTEMIRLVTKYVDLFRENMQEKYHNNGVNNGDLCNSQFA